MTNLTHIIFSINSITLLKIVNQKLKNMLFCFVILCLNLAVGETEALNKVCGQPCDLVGRQTEKCSRLGGLACHEWPEFDVINELATMTDECRIMKLYNRTEISMMDPDEALRLTRYCACKLISFDEDWFRLYDFEEVRRLASMVRGKHNRDLQLANQYHRKRNFDGQHYSDGTTYQQDKDYNETSFDLQFYNHYLWTDIDVTFYGVSIYTSIRDYIRRQKEPKFKLDEQTRLQVQDDETYQYIDLVCKMVAQDELGFYQYLENLNRLNPLLFLEVIDESLIINNIYHASQACKILLLKHLDEYQLHPANPNLVPVWLGSSGDDGSESQLAIEKSSNFPQTLAIIMSSESKLEDPLLRHRKESYELSMCRDKRKLSMEELKLECPIMFQEHISSHWLEHYSLPLERSHLALKCGCQLLLHNRTWQGLMGDKNVQLLDSMLTRYLKRFSLPDLTSTSIWTLFGWYRELMLKFEQSRKYTVNEIILYRLTNNNDNDNDNNNSNNNSSDSSRIYQDDPSRAINQDDEREALDILRKACNLIMFNHYYSNRNNFTTNGGGGGNSNYNNMGFNREELKLIKYLDRLQLIRQDQMFVFQLTLLDENLFRLYTLSKMCRPIIE